MITSIAIEALQSNLVVGFMRNGVKGYIQKLWECYASGLGPSTRPQLLILRQIRLRYRSNPPTYFCQRPVKAEQTNGDIYIDNLAWLNITPSQERHFIELLATESNQIQEILPTYFIMHHNTLSPKPRNP